MGSLVSGSRVGRYVLLEELGGGGMGVVYRARDEDGGRDVALKVLRLSSPEAVRRMRREARVAEGLDRTRVAEVYDVGETADGHLYLAMEYVPGRTLRDILRSGQVERGEALRILGEIAATLGGAHRRGIIHRDVKPENVMVQDDGRIVVLDFGIAKQIEASGDAAQATTQLTSEGAMIGTPAYLAPEQALGHDVGPAVDQFALAVTAFELLTGKLPWTATEVTRVLAQLLADTPPAASTLNRTLPRPYDAVLWRALSKAPRDRFPSVEAFVEALGAAERGGVVASPVSQSVEGPIPGDVAVLRERPSASHARRTWVRPMLVGLLVVGLSGGTGALVRARMRMRQEPSRAAQPLPTLVASSSSPLACPIFDVSGLPELGPWIGAAAASLACGRAKWYLGGRDDGVVPPAALLDAPVQPVADVPDLYDVPGQREHTLDIVRKRGLPYLDGRVVRVRETWRADLFVRAADGTEIAHASGGEADRLLRAIKNAVNQLWQQPRLRPRAIDPEVARWTGLSDVEAGLTWVDLMEQTVDHLEACATVERRAVALGSAFFAMHAQCNGPPLDAGLPRLDESSPSALVTSLSAVAGAGAPFPPEDQRRVAEKLADLRAAEPSRIGRAYLAYSAGVLWSILNENDRSRTAFLSALVDDPLIYDAWGSLADPTNIIGSSPALRSLASSWFPDNPSFLNHALSTLSDELDARLHDARLAYLLFPNLRRILYLGRALAEAGREDEVRGLMAATPADLSAPDPREASMLLAFVDLHDSKLSRALDRFESAGPSGLYQVSVLAPLLGRERTATAKWATAMLGMGEAQAKPITDEHAEAIAVCMKAGAGLAERCVSRVEKLSGTDNDWGVSGGAFLRGAKSYAIGDLRGAVDAWRPVVGGPDDGLVRLLPTEAFEHVGEDGLAARIDARKMNYRYFAGISDATPREALRAFKQGDRARARELAKKVVDAWEVADAVIPAVAQMRALLAK